MYVMTLTREDVLDDPHLSGGRDVGQWQPLVVWEGDLGTFFIGDTAISYCPWCGAQLPDNSQEALAKLKNKGVLVDFSSPSGIVEVSVDGIPVDADKWLADLQNLTKGQD